MVIKKLAEFQKQCPPITRNKTASIRSVGANKVFSYADLPYIKQVVQPVLDKLNLLITQTGLIDGGGVMTSLHDLEDGDSVDFYWRSESKTLNSQQDVARLGYERRVGYMLALGLIPDGEDPEKIMELKKLHPISDKKFQTVLRNNKPETLKQLHTIYDLTQEQQNQISALDEF